MIIDKSASMKLAIGRWKQAKQALKILITKVIIFLIANLKYQWDWGSGNMREGEKDCDTALSVKFKSKIRNQLL